MQTTLEKKFCLHPKVANHSSFSWKSMIPEGLRYDFQFFRGLDGLGSSFRIKLEKDVGNMCFHRAFGKKKLLSDLLVTQSFCHFYKNVMLPLCKSHFFDLLIIDTWDRIGCGNGGFILLSLVIEV